MTPRKADKAEEKAPEADQPLEAGPTRYAVYDLTYLRFLTPTYESKKDADAVAKANGNAEVREV